MEEKTNDNLNLKESDGEKFINSMMPTYKTVPMLSVFEGKHKKKPYINVKLNIKKRKQCVGGSNDPYVVLDKLQSRVEALQEEIMEIYQPGVMTTAVGTKYKLKKAEDELAVARSESFYTDEIEFREAIVMARRVQEAQQMAMLSKIIEKEEKKLKNN
jgi:hypothetical protein